MRSWRKYALLGFVACSGVSAVSIAAEPQTPVANFTHVAIVTTDMDEAIKLWRDVMGFTIGLDAQVPDEKGALATQPLLDDIFKAKGARARIVSARMGNGQYLELLQIAVPNVEKPSSQRRGHGYAGIREVGIAVPDVDAVFHKLRAAGYETVTEYMWGDPPNAKGFMFYDKDGNIFHVTQRISPSNN